MPRSKRNKVVSLTKTNSKGREQKTKLIDNLRESIDEYNSIYMFSYENMRTVNFTDVRVDFKDSKLFMGKNSIAQLAFGRTVEEEYKDNLRNMSKVSKWPQATIHLTLFEGLLTIIDDDDNIPSSFHRPVLISNE